MKKEFKVTVLRSGKPIITRTFSDETKAQTAYEIFSDAYALKDDSGDYEVKLDANKSSWIDRMFEAVTEKLLR